MEEALTNIFLREESFFVRVSEAEIEAVRGRADVGAREERKKSWRFFNG